MIEATTLSGASFETTDFSSFDIEAGFSEMESIEGASFNIEADIAGSPQSSISGSAVDYIVSSKNSLVEKSIDIKESYLGDEDFTFKDKMQMLEKTYSYQLEMTYYNTFMSQTMQKVDSLIQLK